MAQRRATFSWPKLALILGLGGAAYAYLTLTLTQFFIRLFSGGRIVRGGEGVFAIILVMIIVSLIGLLLLARVLRFPLTKAGLIIAIWLMMYMLTWITSLVLVGLSLPIFLIAWLIFGLGVGFAFGETQPSSAVAGLVASPIDPTSIPTLTREPRPVVQSSTFGRIPSDTVVLLNNAIRSVTGPISSALPPNTPQELRDFTIHTLLAHILRDWWHYQNTAGLRPQDSDDLKSCVAMAAALAAQANLDPTYRDALSQAIYRATLTALLDDWLHAWNANGVDGPPQR